MRLSPARAFPPPDAGPPHRDGEATRRPRAAHDDGDASHRLCLGRQTRPADTPHRRAHSDSHNAPTAPPDEATNPRRAVRSRRGEARHAIGPTPRPCSAHDALGRQGALGADRHDSDAARTPRRCASASGVRRAEGQTLDADAWRSRCILLFDFASALPSISRNYLGRVTKAMALPSGYRTAVGLLYGPATTSVGRPTDGPTESFPVTSGVPQRCPLSGSMFTAALRPLLELLVRECGPERVFIYADDVAVILRSVVEAGRLPSTFTVFDRASGLQLKPQKCLLVPLRLHDSEVEANIRRYAHALAAVAPPWKER